MVSTNRKRYAMAALMLLLATPVFAQAPAPPAGAPGAPAPNAIPGSQPEPKLAFDREVFSYPAEGRRDPFRPLSAGPGAGGPLFNDLALRGIIYSPDARRSVALVMVGGKRTYRLRRGDIIGNARVLEIQPTRVRFAVEIFGTVRNEVLELGGRNQFQGEPIREVPAGDTAAARPRNNPRLNPDTVRIR